MTGKSSDLARRHRGCRTAARARRHRAADRRRAPADSMARPALVAQGIEQRPPEPCAQVRILPGAHDSHRRRARGGEKAPLDLPVEGTSRRGDHLGTVHRLRGLRDRVPAPCDRLHPRTGRLQAVPPRGGTGRRRLRARHQGLHFLHEGLPALPDVGARGRHAPVRARARPRRDVGHLLRHPADPGQRGLRVRGGPRRRAGVGHPHLVPRERHHRRGPHQRGRVAGRWRAGLEGVPDGGHQPRRGAAGRGQPLHLLGQPHRLRGGQRDGACSA